MSLEFYTLSNKERRRYDFEFNNCDFIFAISFIDDPNYVYLDSIKFDNFIFAMLLG